MRAQEAKERFAQLSRGLQIFQGKRFGHVRNFRGRFELRCLYPRHQIGWGLEIVTAGLTLEAVADGVDEVECELASAKVEPRLLLTSRVMVLLFRLESPSNPLIYYNWLYDRGAR